MEIDSYYNAVNNAYMNGWISEAASFLPENPIKKEEAVKIIVNALNYKGMANQDGGYPQGYIITAGKIGLLKRINMSDSQTLTRDRDGSIAGKCAAYGCRGIFIWTEKLLATGIWILKRLRKYIILNIRRNCYGHRGLFDYSRCAEY